MTTLSAHAPAFLANANFYHRIAKSDVFVMHLGVQFEKGSFINRNRIQGVNGPVWLTVPVKLKGYVNGSISTMGVERAQPWKRKHRALIHSHYIKAPHFKENWPKIQGLYDALTGGTLVRILLRDYTFWMIELGMA
ncbi:hypothetical protein LCGC14_3002480, partial [marine sediment metagenome]